MLIDSLFFTDSGPFGDTSLENNKVKTQENRLFLGKCLYD
jgi:hypothetical protein